MTWNYNDADYGATLHNSQARLGGPLNPNCLFRWVGAPPIAQLCGAGQDPDGVTAGPITEAGVWGQPPAGTYATPGRPVKVMTGAAFPSGANLQSDAFGRAIQHASGPVVLRALEASSGAGQVVWAVFTSGR